MLMLLVVVGGSVDAMGSVGVGLLVWVVLVRGAEGRAGGGGFIETMVLHMSRRRTRVRFTWETTPVGWLQTWSSTE